MKTIKFLVITALLTSNVIFAQEGKLSEEQKEKAKAQLEVYFEKLNLSEDQKSKYEEITTKYGNQLKLIKDSGLSKQEKLKEVQRIQADKDTEIKQLLSSEQYDVYTDFKTEQRKNLISNHSGEFAEYLNKIDLTEEQQPKFIEISKKYANQLKSLKNSSKSRFSKYRAFKTIQKNKDAEMKQLLNKQQYEAYLEVQEEIQKKIKEKRNK